MNLLILERSEVDSILPSGDRRHHHIQRVLGKSEGDEVAAGLACGDPFGPAPGTIGIARIERLDEGGLALSFRGLKEAPPLAPIRLVLGFPRPIQAGRIFKDLASLGVAEIILTGTALGEKSYLESGFFRDGEYRRHLIEGAEQAANPRLPRVSRKWTLATSISALRDTTNTYNEGEPDWRSGDFIFLHPGGPRLGELRGAGEATAAAGAPRPVTLAVGSERGWSEAEVALFLAHGFALAGLGSRILKTETATVAAVSILLRSLSLM